MVPQGALEPCDSYEGSLTLQDQHDLVKIEAASDRECTLILTAREDNSDKEFEGEQTSKEAAKLP